MLGFCGAAARASRRGAKAQSKSRDMPAKRSGLGIMVISFDGWVWGCGHLPTSGTSTVRTDGCARSADRGAGVFGDATS